MAWLERGFEVPPGWPSGCRLVLYFESVAGECQVFVNGRTGQLVFSDDAAEVEGK